MPNALGISFDQCVDRFTGVASVRDPKAFCGSLEKLIGLGKSMDLGVDAVERICPPCAASMREKGMASIKVGGEQGIPSELRKSLIKMGGGFQVRVPVAKSAQDGDAVTVTGWAAVITHADGTPVIDYDGDLIPVAELEGAAHRALKRSSGAGRVGDMHDNLGAADLVESMVLTAEKRAALGFGTGPEGWAVTLRVNDPELAKQIRTGEKSELSIRGSAKRVPVDGAADGVAVLKDLELSDLELLSVVDAGASGDDRLRPSIVLVKSRGTYVHKQTDKKGGGFFRRIADIFKAQTLTPEQAEALSAILKEGDPMPTLDEILAALPEDQRAVITAAIADAAKATPPEPEAKADDELTDEQMKSLPPAARKAIEESRELRKRVDSLESDAAKRDALAKARDLSAVPGAKIDDLASLIKAARSLPEADRKTLDAILSTTNATIVESTAFSELGKKSHGVDSAQGRLEAEIDRVVDGDPDLKKMRPKQARAVALTRVGKSNPELVKAARSEAH